MLHTGGGETLYAREIARLLLRFDGTVNVWVPSVALSSGTFVVLLLIGKCKIYVRKGALFGPVDMKVNDWTLKEAEVECNVNQGSADRSAIAAIAGLPLVHADRDTLLEKHCLPHISEMKRPVFLKRICGSTTFHDESSFDDREMVDLGVPLIVNDAAFPPAILSIHPWTFT